MNRALKVVLFFFSFSLFLKGEINDYLNSKVFLQVLEPLQKVLQKKGVVILDANSKYQGYATLVANDGYAFAKKSEFENLASPIARIDQSNYNLKLLKSFEEWDLVLIQLEKCAAEPIAFAQQDTKRGSVVISHAATSLSKRRVKLGIISANKRMPADSGLMLPFWLLDKGGKLILEEAFLPDFKSYKSWEVLEVNGEKVDSFERFEELTKDKTLGATVELLIGKEDQRKQLNPSYNWKYKFLKGPTNGNEAMSGRTSKRRAGFPEIIQHDTPLSARSMGGALINLDGKLVGMNIARYSRAETYAIPVETFKILLNEFQKQQ